MRSKKNFLATLALYGMEISHRLIRVAAAVLLLASHTLVVSGQSPTGYPTGYPTAQPTSDTREEDAGWGWILLFCCLCICCVVPLLICAITVTWVVLCIYGVGRAHGAEGRRVTPAPVAPVAGGVEMQVVQPQLRAELPIATVISHTAAPGGGGGGDGGGVPNAVVVAPSGAQPQQPSSFDLLAAARSD